MKKICVWGLLAKPHWNKEVPETERSFKSGIEYVAFRGDEVSFPHIFTDLADFQRNLRAAKSLEILPDYLVYDGNLDQKTFGEAACDLSELLAGLDLRIEGSSSIPRQLKMQSDILLLELSPLVAPGFWSRFAGGLKSWREAFSSFDH